MSGGGEKRRNVTVQVAFKIYEELEKTQYERRYDTPFRGLRMPFGAEI